MQVVCMTMSEMLTLCVEALPPDQAAPLWQQAQAQAVAFLTEDYRA
jgi:hypothetical protein